MEWLTFTMLIELLSPDFILSCFKTAPYILITNYCILKLQACCTNMIPCSYQMFAALMICRASKAWHYFWNKISPTPNVYKILHFQPNCLQRFTSDCARAVFQANHQALGWDKSSWSEYWIIVFKYFVFMEISFSDFLHASSSTITVHSPSKSFNFSSSSICKQTLFSRQLSFASNNTAYFLRCFIHKILYIYYALNASRVITNTFKSILSLSVSLHLVLFS